LVLKTREVRIILKPNKFKTMSLPTPEEFEKLSLTDKLEAVIKAMTLVNLIKEVGNLTNVVSKETEKDYQDNFDRTFQQVGDVIKLTSMLATGYLWDAEHLKNRTLDRIERLALLQKTAIVVEINCRKELQCNHCEHPHNVNTLIYFPDTKEKFYTMNEFLTSI
jgi:hypothetical protein